MAKSDIGYTGPGLLGLRPGLNVPTQAPDLAGAYKQATAQRDTQRVEEQPPRRGARVLYNKNKGQFAVGGVVFDSDDYAAVLDTEPLLSQEMEIPEGEDWVEIEENDYRKIVDKTKNPTVGDRIARNFGIGMANYISTLGGAAQFAGFEDFGSKLVMEQERIAEKLSPFQQEFTKVSTPEEAGAAVIGTLSQLGPYALETALLAAAGAAVGGATGANPLTAIGGAALSLSGRQAIKKTMLEAARKYTAKEALTKADMTALRMAKNIPEVMKIAGGPATVSTARAVQALAKKQAAVGGAAAATTLGNYVTQLGEQYGEQREQGAAPEDMEARLKAAMFAVPATALDTATDLLTGGIATGLLRPSKSYRELVQDVSKPKAAARVGAEVLKRGAKAAAISAPLGGLSEAGQEALLLAATNQDFSKPENVNRLLESLYAGMAAQGIVDSIANIATPVDVMRKQALPNPNKLATGQEPPAVAPEPEEPAPTPPAEAGPIAYGNLPPPTAVPPTEVPPVAPPTEVPTTPPLATVETPPVTIVQDAPAKGAGLTKRVITLSNGVTVNIEKSQSGWNIVDEEGNLGEFLGRKKEDALTTLTELGVATPRITGSQRVSNLQQELQRVDDSILSINRRLTAIDTQRVQATPEQRQELEAQKAQLYRMRDFITRDVRQAETAPSRTEYTPASELYTEAVRLVVGSVVKPDATALSKSMGITVDEANTLLRQLANNKLLVGTKGKYKLSNTIPTEVSEDVLAYTEKLAPPGRKYELIPELGAAVERGDFKAVVEALRNSENPTIRSIADRAKYLVGKANIRVVPDGSMGTNVAGQYFYAGNQIGNIEIARGYAMSGWVVAHEIVHALTTLQIKQRPNSPAVRRLQELYDYVKSLAAFQEDYGLTNIAEFVTEGLANKEFQRKLNQIRYKGATLWTRFTRAIADIIGVKYNTALTELLSVYSDITTQQELDIDALLVSKRGRSKGISAKGDQLRRGKTAATVVQNTIDVDGVQRSTTNSEGRPIHPTQEGIRNFWRWFGDSKVVDEQGRPLVVYHGTAKSFNKFSLSAEKTTDSGFYGKGFYFSPNKDVAKAYAPQGRIVEAYLAIQNPYTFSGSASQELMRKLGGGPEPDTASINTAAGTQWAQKVRDGLIRLGHDGVFPDTDIARFANEIVAFNPEQIKSAVGNVGTFSPESDNIAKVRITPDEARRFQEETQQESVSQYPEGRRRLAKNRQDRNIPTQDEGAGREAGDTRGVQQSGRVEIPAQDKITEATGVAPTVLVPKFKPSKVEQIINGMPIFLRSPLQWIYDSFGNAAPRAIATVAMGNMLTDAAVRYGVTSAMKYARLTRERGALVERRQEAFVKWAEDYNRLPAEYQGVGYNADADVMTVNGLIERMTREGKWAFQPTYFRGKDADTKVEINSELKRFYDAMPKDAKEIVQQAFKLNYDLVMDMKRAVLDATNSEYDVLIANAKDDNERKSLEKEKQNSLTQYQTMLTLKTDVPYAPLSRYGSYVVIGKSDAYIAAQDAGDVVTMQKLQSDPKHYYVDYAENRAEAAKMRRDIINDYGGKEVNAQIAENSEAEETLYGGRDMMYAFQRLNSLISEGVEGEKTAKQLRRQVTQLQLLAMATSSVRKAELQRRNVASGNLDMVRAILSRGRAGAHFVGSVYKNREIVDTISDMRKEARANVPNREERQALYNGILNRYVDDMTPQEPVSLADSLTSFTSLWMLGFAPSYYLQQGMQNFMIAIPQMAKTYGYKDSSDRLAEGYRQVMKAWSDRGVTEQLNVDNVDDKYKALAHFLAESGELDVGINKEMGTLSGDNGVVTKVMDTVRALTRKIEAINRLSAGIAMYDLELAAAKGGKQLTRTYDAEAYASYLADFKQAHPKLTPLTELEFAAANNALKLIVDAHGNYSAGNTPLFLRGSWAGLFGQFQKFRIILGGLYAREIHHALFGLTKEEREIARRALAYMTGHAAIAGGLLGTPIAVVFKLVHALVTTGDDEREDMERDVREAIGNDVLANLLLRGLPTLAGVDASATLGQGNLLAVAPYTDIPTDKDSYAKYILALTGPSIGGIGGNMVEAYSLATNGNYYKAMEKLMPRGLMALARSYREATEGQTTKGGDVLTRPEEISAIQTLWSSIGLQPIERVNRQFAADQVYKDAKFYRARTSELKRAYISAVEKKDTAEIKALKDEWRRLQDLKAEKGIRRQPLLNLLSAPREQRKREKNVVGGVPYTSGTRGQAEQLARLVTRE